MSEDERPPIYYVALHTLMAYEQANYANSKRKREADKRNRGANKKALTYVHKEIMKLRIENTRLEIKNEAYRKKELQEQTNAKPLPDLD